MNVPKLHVRMLPIVVLAAPLYGPLVGSARDASPATSGVWFLLRDKQRVPVEDLGRSVFTIRVPAMSRRWT